MKEYQLRHSLGRTIAFSFCLWASVAGFFSCDSDRLNGGGSIGMLSLNLAADTANIKGGTLSTKAGNVLEDFEDVDGYRVQIFQESDTLTSVLYKDFPQEMEIKEGSYTLRASKGEILPAAFDNPYFEGSTDFVIKKDMKTPLEVTCTMANARVYAEYSEDFLKAYSDYSVSLKTSYMDDVFTVAKGETRGAYLQVAKEGTPLSIAISLMRENWDEAKAYTVTNPSITLNPKESVTLKFATDGKTGDGLDLSIELDDSMEEAELEFGIPDFMWKPFTDLRIWACGFENNVPVEMNVTDGYPGDSCIIKAEVPGRIKECWVVRLDGGEKLDSVDIATAEGLKTAEDVWGLRAVSSPIAGVKGLELDLKGAFNQLYASDENKICGFSVYINDALNVMHTSDVITASVNLKAAKVPTVGQFELAVPSKHALEKDTAIAVVAEAGIKALTLNVSKDGVIQQYDLLGNNSPEGIYYDKQKNKIVFQKECSNKLESKETDASIYSYEVLVTDKLGQSVTVTSKLTVTPVFTIVVPEGGVWTNRATIQVVETTDYPKSYQLKVGDQWQDYSDATITGLQPNTTYTVRALVNNWPTTEATFTTEAALQIPNGNMESWSDWTKELWNGANGVNKINITAGQPQGWSTVNDKTFGGDPNVKSTWNLRPSTIKSIGHKGNGALIRSVGWDNDSGNSYKVIFVTVIYHFSAGKLFLGNYSYDHSNNKNNYDYGIPFSSRPAKVKFVYKYQPYKDDNSFSVRAVAEHREGTSVTRIGYSEYIGSNVSDNYIDETFSIIYDPQYLNLKATHFYLEFSSSSKYDDLEGKVNNNPYLDKVFSHYDNGYKYFEGSNLYIDDVELIYE